MRVKDVLLALAASASLIFFLIAYSKPPGAAVAFSYAGLIVGLQILSHLLYFGMRPGTSRNIFRYLAPAAIAAIVCMAWHFDSYETRHELENGGTYIVTFSRMGVPQSEWISSGGLGHGPLTPSGKRHGRWEFIGSDGSGGLAVTPVFYWYGERVTEAEFHSKPPPPRPSVVERFWLAFILLYGLAWGALALPLRRGHGRRKCGDTGPASECKS